MLPIDPLVGARFPGGSCPVWLCLARLYGERRGGPPDRTARREPEGSHRYKKAGKNKRQKAELPPVPSEFSFKLPEESWWLPTQPPMDVSAEQPELGSSPPGPQLQLHPLAPHPPRFPFSHPPLSSPFPPPSFQAAGTTTACICGGARKTVGRTTR